MILLTLFVSMDARQMIELAPGSYRSARVLNQGARTRSYQHVAYVNSDAIMEDDDVLVTLGAGA